MNDQNAPYESSPKDALDLLGEAFIKQVRDASIIELNKMLHGQLKGMSSKMTNEWIKEFDSGQIATLENILIYAVDMCLHNTLWMFEQQEEQIAISVKAGAVFMPNLSLISDGLAGELYGSQGWISRFSNVSSGKSP